MVRTGRSDGQLEHWLKALPVHVAQSGWQVTHWPDELNDPVGQDATHLPFEANWLFAHVKQNVDDPAQVPQDESQAAPDVVSPDSCSLAATELTSASDIVLRVKERPCWTFLDAYAVRKNKSRKAVCALHLIDCRCHVER